MPAARLLLTTPDLVVLSLLAERPMHGYEVNAELERRNARDWMAISRPQIYYSLEKLRRLGLLVEQANPEPALGAERCILATSAKGRTALTLSLERPDWATERNRPLFLTWFALSAPSPLRMVRRQIRRRIRFLESTLSREQKALRVVRAEVGHQYHQAAWMILFTISQFKTELRWLDRVRGELGKRARRG